MTKQQMLKQCAWDEYDIATLTVYSEMLETEVKVVLHSESSRNLTDKMVDTLNDFLKLEKDDLSIIKELLWQDCKECFDGISYGVSVKEGETETEANHREFGIYNQEDAYAKSYFDGVSIQEENEFKNRYATIDSVPVWEQEHGCSIIMKNGQLIAKYSNDPYFGQYE